MARSWDEKLNEMQTQRVDIGDDARKGVWDEGKREALVARGV